MAILFSTNINEYPTVKKLLILGAGGHGKVVAEVAQTVGYDEIAFLDDNSDEAIGRISDMAKLFGQYTEAFVGIGNNNVRHEMLQKLIACGYTVPTLIHPMAYVSKSAKVGQATVIEPMAIVNANSIIGDGCIISVGSIVDHDCVIGECCHINAGAIVMSGCNVDSFMKIDAGMIKRNDISKADSNCTFAKEYAEQNKIDVSFFSMRGINDGQENSRKNYRSNCGGTWYGFCCYVYCCQG